MELLLITIITGLVAVFALTDEVGVDSRDFSDDPHRSEYPIGIA